MKHSKKKIIEPQDKTKVNVKQQWQLRYWTKELNIPVKYLQSLVRKAGSSIDNIRHALKESRLYTGQ